MIINQKQNQKKVKRVKTQKKKEIFQIRLQKRNLLRVKEQVKVKQRVNQRKRRKKTRKKNHQQSLLS